MGRLCKVSGIVNSVEYVIKCFQDVTELPKPSSVFGRSSISSTSSNFFDALSEGNADFRLTERIELDKRVLEWKERFQIEHDKRLQAEQSANDLANQKNELNTRIQSLQRKLERISELQETERGEWAQIQQQHASQFSRDDSQERQVVVARLVSAMLAKIVAKDESERKWSTEVHILRQRVERSRAMQDLIEKLRQQELEKQIQYSDVQETDRRKYIQICLAVGFAGAGALATSVFIKNLHSTW